MLTDAYQIRISTDTMPTAPALTDNKMDKNKQENNNNKNNDNNNNGTPSKKPAKSDAPLGQFGYGILKIMGPKMQEFCPRINILVLKQSCNELWFVKKCRNPTFNVNSVVEY